jgi:hypothetical protein
MNADSITPTQVQPRGRMPVASPSSCLSNYRRWLVMFDVDGEPFNISVMSETRRMAIEYAEGVLWLQLGKPNLDGFAPWCLSACEVY